MSWSPSEKKPVGPQAVSKLLEGIPAYRIIRAWHDCAGPALLKQTRFLGLHSDAQGVLTLHLDVPDPVWRQELGFQKDEILKRYRAALANLGFLPHELPKACSFGAVTSVPFQSVNAQKGRYKKRV